MGRHWSTPLCGPRVPIPASGGHFFLVSGSWGGGVRTIGPYIFIWPGISNLHFIQPRQINSTPTDRPTEPNFPIWRCSYRRNMSGRYYSYTGVTKESGRYYTALGSQLKSGRYSPPIGVAAFLANVWNGCYTPGKNIRGGPIFRKRPLHCLFWVYVSKYSFSNIRFLEHWFYFVSTSGY